MHIIGFPYIEIDIPAQLAIGTGLVAIGYAVGRALRVPGVRLRKAFRIAACCLGVIALAALAGHSFIRPIPLARGAIAPFAVTAVAPLSVAVVPLLLLLLGASMSPIAPPRKLVRMLAELETEGMPTCETYWRERTATAGDG